MANVPLPRPEPAPPVDDDAYRFYLANRDGIDSWNAYVAEHGLPLAEYSDL
jgi:hypothetical protein